jgi:hypothetical protein
MHDVELPISSAKAAEAQLMTPIESTLVAGRSNDPRIGTIR